ncbi:MAG: outer membrane beta-barrel protein [Alphaproteobacteria bacterium]|nr:MAG: outer membrane beta-barrel protein [Alphaproteobacteria bacterium]
MTKRLTCLTLWAAMSAVSLSADNAIAHPSSSPAAADSKKWSVLLSVDLAGKNLTVRNRMQSSTTPAPWSKTTESKRAVLPGFTVQGHLNIGESGGYLGAEISYLIGDLKAQSNSPHLLYVNKNHALHHRRMSHMIQTGLIIGKRFGDSAVHLKAGVAFAKVRHRTFFDRNQVSNLHYDKNATGYYVGVGYVKNIAHNFAVGIDYEYALYRTEKKAFDHPGAVRVLRNKGNFKSQATIDTLKLRFIYKI